MKAAQSLSLPFIGGLSVGGLSRGGLTGSEQGRPSRRTRPAPGTDQVACVDTPELPLQMLLRKHPTWRSGPAAVVAEDRPEAPLLFVNRVGWRKGLRPGIRYGEARGLVSMLRAAPVLSSEVDALCEELTHALQTFSPRVEPDHRRRGVFYLDPKGLTRIYEDLQSWGEAISGYFKGRGFDSAVVVAHGRFASYALSRSFDVGRWQVPSPRSHVRPRARVTKAPVRIFESENDTQAALDRVPLERLDLPPKLRDGLAQLTVTHVGDLRSVSAESLLTRFGEEAGELRSLLSNDSKIALNPAPPPRLARVEREIDPPDNDHTRLLFSIKGLLHELLLTVASRGETLRALHIELHLEGPWQSPSDGVQSPSDGVHRECITPARSTRDLMTLLDLIRLRLSDITLSAPIESVALEGDTEPVEGDQLVMFRSTRDLEAGARAVARVRATFGERSVTRAKLKEAHLPEARFSWEPTQTVLLPSTTPSSASPSTSNQVSDPDGDHPPLIRRLFRHPKPIATPPSALIGPYRISGGWWVREVVRDYYYAETENGELLWLFYDRARHRWFVHGIVD